MSGKRFLYPDEFKTCDSCHGKGTVYCIYCHGKGYTEEEVRRYDSSGRYHTERESRSCSYCLSKGERTCIQCGGTGDQMIYKNHDEIPDTPLEDFSIDTSLQTKEDYKALYKSKLLEAELKREEIVTWIQEQSGFAAEYRAGYSKWLRDFSLDQPAAEAQLKDAGVSLSQPGLSRKAETLGIMLKTLSVVCGAVQMNKMMST